MDTFDSIIKYIKSHSNIEQIDTRIEKDMEKKYILILANADIVITENGTDKVVGNALNDPLKKYLDGVDWSEKEILVWNIFEWN